MVGLRLKDFAEGAAGYLISAGQFALVLFVFIFIWPEKFRFALDYIGIDHAHVLSIISILLVIMFLSSPFILYSASVGFSRMSEIEDMGHRIAGRAYGIVLFLTGFANVVIPIAWLGAR